MLAQPRYVPMLRVASVLVTVWLVHVFVVFVCQPAAMGDEPAPLALHERIDQLVESSRPMPLNSESDDASFLRRIYLDLAGRTPAVDEARQFLENSQADRRQKLIDDLLASPEFERHFALTLDIMLMERRPDKRIPTDIWREYLRQSISANVPLDQLFREILSADGTGETKRPAAKFYLDRDVEMNALARDVSRMVFGKDIQCAQCHDHPLISDYHQSDFYGIVAFLSRTSLFEDDNDGKKAYLAEKADGRPEFSSVFEPDSGKSVARPLLPASLALDTEPLYSGEHAYVVAPAKGVRSVPRFSLRQQLAILATHPKSVAFNRNLANRLWACFFGVGIVHPVDMHHSDNPPIHAELLEALADGLVSVKYDLREFARQILLSRTYQRSTQIPDVAAIIGSSSPSALDPKAIRQELETIDARVNELSLARESGQSRLAEAESALLAAQADVEKLDAEIESLRNNLQSATQQQATLEKQIAEARDKLKTAQESAVLLQSASAEAAKAAEKLTDDKEVAAAAATLAERAKSTAEAVVSLEAAIAEHQKAMDETQRVAGESRAQLDDRESRHWTATAFVAESRGIHRAELRRDERLGQELSDLEQRQALARLSQDYLNTRSDNSANTTAADNAARDLIDAWVRRYAIKPLRGLTPEQMAASTVMALGLNVPYQRDAEAEWTASHKDQPESQVDSATRAKEIEALYLKRVRDVESTFVSLFAGNPGAPQDVFQATVDQALFFTNDSRIQNWLQPTDGTLMHRLQSMGDDAQLATEMYLSILSRTPTSEETASAHDYLAVRSADRQLAVQELVWGLLTSLEFRFIP